MGLARYITYIIRHYNRPDPEVRNPADSADSFGMKCLSAALLLSVLSASCAAPRSSAPKPDGDLPPEQAATPSKLNGVTVTVAPYDQVHVNWKQRLDQPYVYVEYRGDYRKIGSAIRTLQERVDTAGIVPLGELFCLYYDDPGWTDTAELRARACLPVNDRAGEGFDLGYDVLPSETVVYAVVAGPPGVVPRTYPQLFEYISRRNWEREMPIREVYLNVGESTNPSGLLTEVQVPWTYANAP